MSEAVFSQLYRNLNPKQREAVDAIEGPVMVIAGPGTGKTSILTLRIANILRLTDTPPDAILAITFTESGAYSMRRKLVPIIGSAAYRVGIFTFHGFANHIIGRFQESFPRIVGSRPATNADQARILEEIFLYPNRYARGGSGRVRGRFKRIRPSGDIFHYLPKALRAIGHLKRENISPDALRNSLASEERALLRAPERLHRTGRFKGALKATYRDRLREIEKARELAVVYRAYEAALARERLFDFEDMLLEVIRALREDRDLRLTLQEQYHYVLADEHQDANNAQNRMLELLASFDDRPNLFVVGDEKQAIYRFQGASLENFLYFRRCYPAAQRINLTDNYRSTQAILDASHSLMEKGRVSSSVSRAELRPRLRGRSVGVRRNIRFFEFARPDGEVSFLISDIGARLAKGASPREVAVLVRDNEDAQTLAEALERTQIPFTVLADDDLLRDGELGKLFMILEAVVEPGSEARFSEMLHLDFLGVPPLALYDLLRFCRERRVSLFVALRDGRLRRAAGLRKDEAILRVFADFERWATVARNSSASDAVERIARESGFTRRLLTARGSLRSLEKLDALFSALKEFSAHQRVFRLAEFLETLKRIRRHGLRLSGRGARPEFYESVTIMTAHRAKGLEFDTVYIVRAVDGHWGGRRSRTDFYLPAAGILCAPDSADSFDTEDERRLFYVALTRARREVVITMAREGKGGKPALPSQFVEEIDPSFLHREDTAALEKRLSARTPLYLTERINVGPSLGLKEYLQKVFLEQGLTVTALNNYRSCPWEYFFKNLVRLPQIPAPYLLYGTAVHEALAAFFEQLKKRRAGRAELLRLFDRALERSPLPLREFTEYRARGRRALLGYYAARKSGFTKDVRTEVPVTGVFLPFLTGARPSALDGPVGRGPRRGGGKDLMPQLLLRGKLDKIERNPDGTVTVVDYKTGRPKSRAEILGETKSSEGNMKRQLDFYKLLLNNFGEGRYRMTAGAIDFVEPDAKGNYRREVFEVSEGDAAAVAEEAIRIGGEIYGFEFWDRRCVRRDCEYCTLRSAIQ